jgi:hypothetical protein
MSNRVSGLGPVRYQPPDAQKKETPVTPGALELRQQASASKALDALNTLQPGPDNGCSINLRAAFSGVPTPVVETPQTPSAPTAESAFGPEPWIANPTGVAPNGTTYSYNPHYFATRETAAKIAQLIGGKVVEANMMTAAMFQQSQPNFMVQLEDGRLINPGLVASFFTHGYPQSYIDQMIAAEVRNA